MLNHNHIGILREIEKKYPSSGLHTVVKMSTKYFKDSRYSNFENLEAFTKEFANEFVGYVNQVKEYVDEKCAATLGDLQARYR